MLVSLAQCICLVITVTSQVDLSVTNHENYLNSWTKCDLTSENFPKPAISQILDNQIADFPLALIFWWLQLSALRLI